MTTLVRRRREAGKVLAFLRRDVLTALSYPLGVLADWLNMAVQIVLFSFVGLLVDPSLVPAYGDERATYIQFVAIGIAVSSFVQVALQQVMRAVRNEQYMGTLPLLLMTPSAPSTFHLGSAMYPLMYVPLRSGLFLGAVAVVFDVTFAWGRLLPAVLVLIAFLPFVWGLGVVSAGAALTFRRGAGVVGFAGGFMTLLSESYIPLDVLPGWAQAVARFNPLTITLDGIRRLLLGDGGWSVVLETVPTLAGLSTVSLLIGFLAYRWALMRERARGTLGLY